MISCPALVLYNYLSQFKIHLIAVYVYNNNNNNIRSEILCCEEYTVVQKTERTLRKSKNCRIIKKY